MGWLSGTEHQTGGFIHIIFEGLSSSISKLFIQVYTIGHFFRNHKTLISLNDIISQEWKEYAKSDSRYLSSDSFLLAIEMVTSVRSSFPSFWGIQLILRHLTACLGSLVSLHSIRNRQSIPFTPRLNGNDVLCTYLRECPLLHYNLLWRLSPQSTRILILLDLFHWR